MRENRNFAGGTLVFVWNADEGWRHAVMDSLHKVISPRTYPCKLCELTHGIAGPKAQWTNFLKTLDRPVECYHRDQFKNTPVAEQLPGLELPVVLIYSSKKWQILLSRHELLPINDLEGLMKELERKISNAR
ncbi:MAG: hypothetical protein P8Z38_11070 [Robiginitalea sp.]